MTDNTMSAPLPEVLPSVAPNSVASRAPTTVR